MFLFVCRGPIHYITLHYIRTWSTIYTLRKFNFCLAVSDEIFDLFPSKLTRLYVTQSFAIAASVTYSTEKSSKTLLRVYSSLVSGSLTMQSGCQLVFYSFSSQRKHFANFFCNNVTKIQNFALREKTNFIIFLRKYLLSQPYFADWPTYCLLCDRSTFFTKDDIQKKV